MIIMTKIFLGDNIDDDDDDDDEEECKHRPTFYAHEGRHIKIALSVCPCIPTNPTFVSRL
jgi:hypothetical protein